MNRYYFTLPISDKTINIPVEINWDFLGRTDDIEKWETEVLRDVLGDGIDFEVTRFSHDNYSPANFNTLPNPSTSINYEFNFYNGLPINITGITTGDYSNWVTSYLAEGFQASEVYYYRRPFTNSFFKLDFYSSDDEKNQVIYFTIIIPVQQGEFESVSISPSISNVLIRKPKYKLDFVGDKEGFFIYWLTNREYINLDTFYMSAKFFDAKIGVFVRMMNRPQSILNQSSRYTFLTRSYFYNKVVLDFQNYTYKVYDGQNNQRIGIEGNPIKWYEYVNPVLNR